MAVLTFKKHGDRTSIFEAPSLLVHPNKLVRFPFCVALLNEPYEHGNSLEGLVEHVVGKPDVRHGFAVSGSGGDVHAPECAAHAGLEPTCPLDVAKFVELKEQRTCREECEEPTGGSLRA